MRCRCGKWQRPSTTPLTTSSRRSARRLATQAQALAPGACALSPALSFCAPPPLPNHSVGAALSGFAPWQSNYFEGDNLVADADQEVPVDVEDDGQPAEVELEPAPDA